jgi:hypothetical protein
MNIYLVSRRDRGGYDEYDSFVCAAESEELARCIHPNEYVTHVVDGKWMGTYKSGSMKGAEYEHSWSGWIPYTNRGELHVELIGSTPGLILASFNAG